MAISGGITVCSVYLLFIPAQQSVVHSSFQKPLFFYEIAPSLTLVQAVCLGEGDCTSVSWKTYDSGEAPWG